MYEQTHVKTHEKRQGREPHLREKGCAHSREVLIKYFMSKGGR